MGNIINNEAHKAYDFIEKGGVILYPTDTVWGLGCDATNCSAIEKIYQLKKRSLKTPCLLYTSPSPRDKRQSRMPSSA